METKLNVSCKYNRKAKICTPEKKEQIKKYRGRGWTFKRIAEKFNISESRIYATVNGESEAVLAHRRENARKYYYANKEHCIQRITENEMLKRETVPNYNKRRKQYNAEYQREYRKSKLSTQKIK